MSPEPGGEPGAPAAVRSRWLARLGRREHTLRAGSAVTAACNLLATLVSGLLSIVVARLLGAEQLGVLHVYITTVLQVALFSDLAGFYYAAVYLIAQGGGGFSDATMRGTALAYGLASGAVAGVLAAAPPVRSALVPVLHDPSWAALLVLGVAANAALNQARGQLVGRRQFLAVGLLVAAQVVVYAALALGAALGLGWRSALVLGAAHAAASALLLVAVTLAFARRGLGRPSPALLRAGLGIGARAAVVNALSFLHLRLDTYLVSAKLGAAAVGEYAVAVTVGELLTRLPSMMGSVLFPLVAGARDPAAAAVRTLRVALLALGSVALVALPVALAAEPLLRLLYGEAYVASAPLLRWLLPGMAFLSALYLLNNHLAGIGYPPVNLVAMGVALAANASLNWVLLPRIGLVGAPIASTLSYALWLAITVAWFVRRRPGTR